MDLRLESMMGRSIKFFCLIFSLAFLTGCLESSNKKDDSYTFIGRNDYMIDNYEGISYYRLNDSTRDIMDGYYVVGNEISKWEEFDLSDGVLNGDYIIFHNNGNIYTQTKYYNGKKHGEELTYTLNGKLNSRSKYRYDVLTDTSFTYFDNGSVKSISLIEDGKSKESTGFDILGNIVTQRFIEDGRTISQQISKGKVVSEMISSNYDSYEAFKLYNEDGTLNIFLRMLVEKENAYILELDKEGNEIERINVRTNPEKAMEYSRYFN